MTIAYDDEGRCGKCGHNFNDESRNDFDLPSCPACGTARPPAECKKAYQGGCEGDVEWRMNPRSWKPWGAMCEKHYRERLDFEEETNRKYGTYSAVPPAGFDPDYAGERWDEDY